MTNEISKQIEDVNWTLVDLSKALDALREAFEDVSLAMNELQTMLEGN